MPYQGFARQKYGAADAPASAPEAEEPAAEEPKPAADAGAYPDWARLAAVSFGVLSCFALVAIASQAAFGALTRANDLAAARGADATHSACASSAPYCDTGYRCAGGMCVSLSNGDDDGGSVSASSTAAGDDDDGTGPPIAAGEDDDEGNGDDGAATGAASAAAADDDDATAVVDAADDDDAWSVPTLNVTKMTWAASDPVVARRWFDHYLPAQKALDGCRPYCSCGTQASALSRGRRASRAPLLPPQPARLSCSVALIGSARAGARRAQRLVRLLPVDVWAAHRQLVHQAVRPARHRRR